MKKLVGLILLSCFSIFCIYSVQAEQSLEPKVKAEHSVPAMQCASMDYCMDRPANEEVLTLWVEDETAAGEKKEVKANANSPPHNVKANSMARQCE